jgi:hypothetical protein
MERLVEALVQRSPELIGLIWAIWYFGKKLDALSTAISGLSEKIAVLLDRAEVKS